MSQFLRSQVEMEGAALDLLRRPSVRRAVEAQAVRWREGTPDRSLEAYDQLPDSIAEVALLVALQVVNADPRRPEIVEISAGPHRWGGLDVPGGRWGINNPDTLYFAAPVEAGSSYVLRAEPMGAVPTDVNISVQTPDVWGTLSSIGARDLVVEPDGSFTVTVGDPATASAGGRHLTIPDGGRVLLIRQTLADWSTELPYELSVTRTAGPGPASRRGPEGLVQDLIDRLAVVIEHSLHTLQPPIFGLPAHVVPKPGEPGDKPGYLVAQRNTLGHFHLADDEALVLRIDPAQAGYVAVAAPNVWGVTSDSTQHQNSLNLRQAALDPDGAFTVVVANTDPGIDHWIDPGSREGIVMLRWQLLSDRPTDQPAVEAVRTRLDELSVVAPAAAARPASPADRSRQLATRRAGYLRRFSAR